MKTLSHKQLAQLGRESTQAYPRVPGVGTYDSWRHEFTAQICGGISSWRRLEQRHYIPLLNAFRAINGKAPLADRTPKDDAAALIWTLRDRIAFWELEPAYVAAIVRDKTARPWIRADMSLDTMLAGLDPTTLRQLLYTLQARARARAKKAAAATHTSPPQEVHISRSTIPPPRLADHRGDTLAAPPPRPCHRPAKHKTAAR